MSLPIAVTVRSNTQTLQGGHYIEGDDNMAVFFLALRSITLFSFPNLYIALLGFAFYRATSVGEHHDRHASANDCAGTYLW